MMNKKDAEIIIKDLSEKPFVCSKHCIETESGYVITTKEKQKYARSKKQTNADRIRNMNIAGLKIFIERAMFCGSLISNEKSCALCQGCKYPFCQDIEAWLQAEVKEGDENGQI